MNVFRKKLKIGILVSCFIGGICCLTSSCTNTSNNQENTSSLEIKTKNDNTYSYASHLNLSEKELENLLTIKSQGNEYKLIPTTDSDVHKDFWCNLVTTDEKYMQTFFLNRKLPSKSRAESQFNSKIKSMWKSSNQPDSLFFLVMLNGEYCGAIESAELTSEETAFIGYITKKEYSGQGVATNALKIFVNLIRTLNDSNFYNVSNLSLWIFDSNKASINVAKKNGFVYTEADAINKRSRYVLKI